MISLPAIFMNDLQFPMKNRSLRPLCAVLTALTLPLLAEQSPPAGGMDLLDTSAPVSHRVKEGARAEKIPVANQAFPSATRVTVDQPSPREPWNASLAIAVTKGEIRKNDRLLITYMARCTSDGNGQVTSRLQFSSPPYASSGSSETSKPGGKWEQVNQPFIASADIPQGKGEFTLMLGAKKQTVEIAAIRLLNYGATFDLAQLPHKRVSYEGRDVDAPWRQQALDRIEKIRKTDYSAHVVGADGKPLANTPVTVVLHRHAYGFGTAVTSRMLTLEGTDGERYRDIVKRTCSLAVFEDDLKPHGYPHDEKGFKQLEKSFDWLKGNDIPVRGHYLIQEAVDGWTRQRLGDPEKLREIYMNSIRERIEWVGNRVTEWDAVNHPIAWGGAELLSKKGKHLESLSMDVFHQARRLTDLPLWINEDQLFRPGKQQEATYQLLANLKRDGVRVDGLGNQAHFNSSFLPHPEELLRITDRFAEVAPKQMITEFDIVAKGDDQLAADYLRDCMIACFSHPAYDGFLLWGFWEGRHWLPEAALWKKDWTIKAAGKTWEEWVGKRWQTRENLVTDSAGKIAWRGFAGSYRLEVNGNTGNPFQPGDAKTQAIVKAP
jgi:GH35 family endo-1,4-beta-xylanase